MNVLYIDDDASNRAMLREMLLLAGVAMREAGDAETGLEMIERGDFALVLMDLRMPGMSGLTAIRKLRALRGAKGRLPVVVITADPTEGVRQMCAASDANGVVEKPVVANALFQSIGAAMAASGEAVLH